MLRNYGRCVVRNFSNVVLIISPTPSDATVVITATGYTQSGNTIEVAPGTSVTYTVSKTQYSTVTDTVTVYNSQTINVPLAYTPYTPSEVLFDSSTPGTYTLNVLVDGVYNVICVGAGGGGAALSMHYGNRYAVAVAGGGSGGYSNTNVTLAAGEYTVKVGSGGTSFSLFRESTNTSYHGSGAGTTGGESSVGTVVVSGGGTYGYGNVTVYTSGSGSTNANAFHGNGGSGSTQYGNDGRATDASSSVGPGSTYSGSGGASRYGGYGVGGSASAKSGSDGNATANNGGNGYVKVTFNNY